MLMSLRHSRFIHCEVDYLASESSHKPCSNRDHTPSVLLQVAINIVKIVNDYYMIDVGEDFLKLLVITGYKDVV